MTPALQAFIPARLTDPAAAPFLVTNGYVTGASQQHQDSPQINRYIFTQVANHKSDQS
jgi:hypothetical protein